MRDSKGRFIKGYNPESTPFFKGMTPWNKGKITTPKSICPVCKKEFIAYKNNLIRKMFCSRKCSKTGQYNPIWAGEKVGYAGVHAWIKKHFPKPVVCSDCRINPPHDLANISQQYKRDVSDWEWLCRKCHMTKDGRLVKVKRTQYKKGSVPWTKTHKHNAKSLEKMSKTWFVKKSQNISI